MNMSLLFRNISPLKSAVVTAVLIVTVGMKVTVAQTPSPLSFFPHHQGDLWEYSTSTGDSVQNKIISDTIGPDGNSYVQNTMFADNIVDSVNLLVYRIYGIDSIMRQELRYKLDADSGETWTVYQDTNYRESARVISVFQSVLFGNVPVVIKRIDYFGRGVNNVDSLLMDTDYLASNFGLVGQDFDASPTLRIKGTLINGVQHGTITAISGNLFTLPGQFVLNQNFPNPFNPSTRISYDLAHGSAVELTVYDLLGQKVKTLVSSYQNSGTYNIEFTASGLSTGVYVYTLKTTFGIQLKRMVYMK